MHAMGVTDTQVSINSTATTPDIIGVEVKENRAFQTMLGRWQFEEGSLQALIRTISGLQDWVQASQTLPALFCRISKKRTPMPTTRF